MPYTGCANAHVVVIWNIMHVSVRMKFYWTKENCKTQRERRNSSSNNNSQFYRHKHISMNEVNVKHRQFSECARLHTTTYAAARITKPASADVLVPYLNGWYFFLFCFCCLQFSLLFLLLFIEITSAAVCVMSTYRLVSNNKKKNIRT